MNLKFDHLTIVVKNLEETIKSYEDVLGYKLWDLGIIDRAPGVRLAMLTKNRCPRIELVQPNGKVRTQADDFIERNGEGVMGFCFFSENFDADVNSIKEKGIKFRVEKQTTLFPDYPFRFTWLTPGGGRLGAWVEISDEEDLPDFEKQ